MLKFPGNVYYANPARAKPAQFHLTEIGQPNRLKRYICSGSAGVTPTLFASLVEAVTCNIVEAVPVAGKIPGEQYWKKQLVANFFRQELELVICTLGAIYGLEQLVVPSWSSGDDDRGFTFQTSLANHSM